MAKTIAAANAGPNGNTCTTATQFTQVKLNFDTFLTECASNKNTNRKTGKRTKTLKTVGKYSVIDPTQTLDPLQLYYYVGTYKMR